MIKKDTFFSNISEIGIANQPISHAPLKMSKGAKVDEIRDIKDIAKAVRDYVKKKYPNCKFSVSIERYSGGQSLTVSLLEADFNPLKDESFWQISGDGNKYFDVNQFYFEESDKLTKEAIAVLKDVRDFYNQYNYDYSDPQQDYFNVRFYEHLNIGQWNKGFVQVAKKPKTPRTPKPAPEKGEEQPKYAIGSNVIYKTSKGTESGKIVKTVYISSQKTYLYGIENPRGGLYNIWESNVSEEEVPETPPAIFSIGQTVRIKGKLENYVITEVIPKVENGVQLYEGRYTETGDLFFLNENTLELALEDEAIELELNYQEGDVFRRNMEGEEPPNTKITYTILSIGEEKTQYRIDYLDKGTNRLSTKSNEKIIEEIETGFWILYELSENTNGLQEAIDLLNDENDLMWEMYVENENSELRKELRETSNENSMVINEFSADLFFRPKEFMEKYFTNAVKPISYDNSELSKDEFKKTVESKEFINWFGDFRKPIIESICSKVLNMGFKDNDNTAFKEPLIVYHGTHNKSLYSRFKFNKFPLIYFASNKSYAQWFANLGTGIMYECFLDIKYLCDFRKLGYAEITWSDLSLFLNKEYGFFLPDKETQNRKRPVWGWLRNDAPNFLFINTIKAQNFTGIAQIEDNPQDILPDGQPNVTTAYMIFSPEQAKLVRYISSNNAFTDIFFMKKGGKVQSALMQKIKNLKL